MPTPETILTPDEVDTRLGKLTFFDGMPDAATVAKVYDNLDFQRGVETFLSGTPACSLEALRRGMASLGAERSNQVVIYENLLDSKPLFLTGNTDTVYCSVFIDLEKEGPTVVEIPPKCGPGTVNDAYFRFVIDMGGPGPDRGAGGKYLLLPPGAEAPADAEQYFVAHCPGYSNWVILRGFLVDGKPDAATAMFKAGLKVYPLSKAEAPPAMEFINGSRIPCNTIHANTYEFYEELAAVVQREPVALLDPELRGLFASIGIQKGKPFAPDERMKAILKDAVAVGNATARAIWLCPRKEGVFLYQGKGWYTPFVGGSHEWLSAGGLGGRDLDARTLFFYIATVNTPAMVLKMVGVGSQYAMISTDKNGTYLNGGTTYKLTIPSNVPAKDFWSLVVYDTQTRSELQTSKEFPSINNKKDGIAENPDGSVDIYFGPTPLAGKESNWIETLSGKGWCALLRLYGPLDAWFDKTWQPGEIVPLMQPMAKTGGRAGCLPCCA